MCILDCIAGADVHQVWRTTSSVQMALLVVAVIALAAGEERDPESSISPGKERASKRMIRGHERFEA